MLLLQPNPEEEEEHEQFVKIAFTYIAHILIGVNFYADLHLDASIESEN